MWSAVWHMVPISSVATSLNWNWKYGRRCETIYLRFWSYLQMPTCHDVPSPGSIHVPSMKENLSTGLITIYACDRHTNRFAMTIAKMLHSNPRLKMKVAFIDNCDLLCGADAASANI